MAVRPPYAVPLRPDYSGSHSRPSDALVRAVVAAARNALGDRRGAEQIAKDLWPDDKAVQLVMRAATTPATSTATGWAAELAGSAVANLIVGLGPMCAASEIFRRSIQLSFGHAAALTVPGIVASAIGINFVGEGEPIPVQNLVVNGPKLSPCKLPIAVALAREIFQTPNAEALVRLALTESLAAGLDKLLLDDQPAADERPAGLRYGVAAIAAATTDDAVLADVGAVIGAVAPVAGSRIALVASPDTHAAILLRAAPAFPYPVLASSGLASKTVLAVALNALAVAADPMPRFTVSREGIYHAEDAAPLDIGSPGSPTVAAPTRSLFQIDGVALRLILEISWTLRAAGSVAWVQGVTW